ncbi:MAG: isoprenyl transferase [Bauldia sp.]
MPRPDSAIADSPAPELAAGVPRHVGIIMDGNGRWAAARGLPRAEGHRRGMEAVRETVRAAPELGIRYLTLFSFSSENWSRPPDEVQLLFALLRVFVQSDLADLHRNRVRITVIGAVEGVPNDILTMLREAERLTADNDGLRLQVAFNYGGRDEIARAMKRILAGIEAGALTADMISPALISAHLDTAGIPDPDLIIRTGGELRLSNFLLWQSAYAELVFLPIHWPEFDTAALTAALDDFARRTRRYGGLVSARA